MALVPPNLGQTYTKFRSSYWFFWLTILVDFGWILWNYVPWLPHFDDPATGFPHLNIYISIETQIGLTLVGIEQWRMQMDDRRMLRDGRKSDLDMAKQIAQLLKLVEQVQGEVEEL